MKIKKMLQLSAAVSIGMVLVLGVVVFTVAQQMNRAVEKFEVTDEIVKGVFELNILIDDYLLHPEERIKTQWQSRYDTILEFTQIKVFEDPEEQLLLGDLRRSQESVKETFSKLLAISEETPLSQELKKRLTGQLSVKLQAMVSTTFELKKSINAELMRLHKGPTFFVETVVVILTLIIITSFLLLIRVIAKPITILREGAETLGKGNFKHRIEVKSKNEIGQLAASFNSMASALQKSYSGLEREVQERTAELETAKNKSETLLASIGDGVFGIDKEQKIIYFNRQAEEISGYKADEAIGKQYYDVLKFVKVKDKSENVEFIRKALKGYASSMADHTILIRKDKKEVPVADSATPIKDKEDKILGAIVVFRDASKERELEIARTELVSFAGHQLKAPLTYIMGNLEMLKEGKLNAESKELADKIELGVNEMKKLVRDVLNISRIEQGRIELKPEPTQLEEVVDDIVKESAPVAQKRNVKIEFTKPPQPLPELMIDHQYIREIYKNIISNAIKYTEDTVTLSFDKEGDDVIFKCSDNGIGIPEDEQSKIFSKFYVASNAVKLDTKGTGLGLSIAKALIEKMNGRIWFESEENKGTTFYVRLPLIA